MVVEINPGELHPYDTILASQVLDRGCCGDVTEAQAINRFDAGKKLPERQAPGMLG